MALTATAIQQSIQVAGADMVGPVWLPLTAIFGVAIASWALVPSNMVLTGVTTGAVGSGVVKGKLVVRPVPLLLCQATTAGGLLGPNSLLMARAVGVGVANAFTAFATYQGISTGVGVGTEVLAYVTANPTTLVAAIMSTATGFGYTGPVLPQMASAFGVGIANLLSTETRGVGVVTGVAGPAPASGVSVSQVI